jgi:hypothetical protein
LTEDEAGFVYTLLANPDVCRIFTLPELKAVAYNVQVKTRRNAGG